MTWSHEYRRAATGEFRTMLLLADAGIGKTRLSREFLVRKRGRAITLAARAYPLGETVSYGVWSEALERHVRGLGAEEILELCGGFLDDDRFAVIDRGCPAALRRE